VSLRERLFLKAAGRTPFHVASRSAFMVSRHSVEGKKAKGKEA
jgi:hypothetical protein